ncbi:hypothetical protein LLG96_18865 [bacterium]|nr:hypothetical protein [bacterium]
MRQLIVTYILAFGVLTILVPDAVYAQENKTSKKWAGTMFVDENGDGICDTFENSGQGKGLGPGNKKGSEKAGNGFVDSDSDGICDNTAARPGKGFGQVRMNNNPGNFGGGDYECTDKGNITLNSTRQWNNSIFRRDRGKGYSGGKSNDNGGKGFGGHGIIMSGTGSILPK